MSYTQGTVKKRRGRDRRKDVDKNSFAHLSKCAAMGMGCALICALALSLIASAACMLYSDPAALTLPVGIIILYLSSATGGAICAVRLGSDRSSTLFAGGICGAMIFILLGLSSAAVSLLPLSIPSHGLTVIPSLLLRLVCIPASLVGAYLPTAKKNGIKGRKRRK